MDIDKLFMAMKNRQPSILGKSKFHQFAVLLPLIQCQDEIHVLFEVRSMQMRSQPGDVCFPGGRIDATDENPQACAIRETTEELGIEPSTINQIVPLDYVVSDYGTIIYPFVGESLSLETLNLNKAEVAEVFTVPLAYFLTTNPTIYKVSFEAVPERDFPFELIHGGENYDWRPRQMNELFYEYEDRVIWGLTAKIVRHFSELIKTSELKLIQSKEN